MGDLPGLAFSCFLDLWLFSDRHACMHACSCSAAIRQNHKSSMPPPSCKQSVHHYQVSANTKLFHSSSKPSLHKNLLNPNLDEISSPPGYRLKKGSLEGPMSIRCCIVKFMILRWDRVVGNWKFNIAVNLIVAESLEICFHHVFEQALSQDQGWLHWFEKYSPRWNNGHINIISINFNSPQTKDE